MSDRKSLCRKGVGTHAPPSLEVDSPLSLFFDEQWKCPTIDDETVCIRIEKDISIYVFRDTFDTRSTRVMQQRLLRILSGVMQPWIARESTRYRSTRECVRQKCGCLLIDRIARTGSRTGTGRWSLTCYAGCLKRMIITIYKDILGCEILNYSNFYVNIPKLLLLKRFLRN